MARKSWLTLTVALVLAMSACAGDGGEAGEGGGPRELTLWHYETPDSAMGVAWAQAIKAFEKAHPRVTVKFEEKGFEQIQKTASMVLRTKEAPDVMEYNKGNATAGLLSEQGLLTDLTAEATGRGWDKLISPNVQTVAKYDDKGAMGGDKWFGVPNYAEYVTVYYNKDLFDKHGVEVPETFDDFEAALDAFKSKDVTPLANAGAEYLAQQYIYQLALSQADPAWVDAYQRYAAPVDFSDDAWTYGATTFADWVKKGYVAKKSVGAKAEDAGVAFMKGDHPMMLSGSWWFGRVADEAKFEWDTFTWPGSDLVPGSGGNLWVVPQGAENKDLAYEFIDLTMQKAAQNALAENGGVPVAADPSAIGDAKIKTLVENFKKLADGGRLAYYPDWPIPGFYDVWVSQGQKIMNGDPPAQILDNLQKAYDKDKPGQ